MSIHLPAGFVTSTKFEFNLQRGLEESINYALTVPYNILIIV
jgi:hypothetical protein